MKKIVFITFILLGFQWSAYAQVCKISESNDNVEVYSAYAESNTSVLVTVGNDSQNISANVTVQVKVTYKWRNSQYEKTYTGKGLATPNNTSTIKVSIAPPKDNYTIVSVEVTSISGTKCRE